MADPRSAKFPVIVIASRKGDGTLGTARFGGILTYRHTLPISTLPDSTSELEWLSLFSSEAAAALFIAEFPPPNGAHLISVEKAFLWRVLEVALAESPQITAVVLDPEPTEDLAAVPVADFRQFLQFS